MREYQVESHLCYESLFKSNGKKDYPPPPLPPWAKEKNTHMTLNMDEYG